MWDQEEDVSWITLETEAMATGPEEDLEKVRQWMSDSLLQLQVAVHPYLEQAMAGSDTGHDVAEEAE